MSRSKMGRRVFENMRADRRALIRQYHRRYKFGPFPEEEFKIEFFALVRRKYGIVLQ